MADFFFIQLDSDNPVIHRQGEAEFGPTHYCTWETVNGQSSLCTIVNPSRNTLYFVVSGAPTNIVTTDGKPFNGRHEIPPNNPTSNVQALGEFRGVTVTITNVTNPAIDAICHVTVTVP